MCNGHSNIASTKLDELATSKIIIRGKKKPCAFGCLPHKRPVFSRPWGHCQ